MAEFKLSRIRYKWRGAWAATTDYIPDEIISYDGKAYVCLVQHTADTDFYIDLDYLNNDVPPSPVPKWVLMLDGYAWKGEWTPDNYYSKGNIVKYAGNVYLCVIPHTSAINEQGFEIDLIDNWVLHTLSEDWKTEWTPATYYKLNDIVKYFGIIYRCITAHSSAAESNDGLEPDLTLLKWEVVSFAENWTGDWAETTRYRENDLVRYNGVVYRCTVGHISADISDGLEFDIANWAVVRAGTEFKGTWTFEVRYRVNDVVKYGAGLWICNSGHTSDADFDSVRWELFVPGFEYEHQWVDSAVYQLGDIVRYGGYLFVSNLLNINSRPSPESSTWSLVHIGTRIRGEWNIRTSYFVGDLIRRQGQLYVAIADSTGNDTDLPDDGSTIDSTYWELVVPGEKWQGVWDLSTTYVIGDVVMWIAHAYRCVAIHDSLSNNRPDVDTGNTNWVLYTFGTDSNRLRSIGDIKTYGFDVESETVRTKALDIEKPGDVLKVVNGNIQWSKLWETAKVYYVSTTGADMPGNGTTLNSPWKTIRYACENITGYATVLVKQGLYSEVLPIRVPAFVAIVGDELRGTIVQPAATLIPAADAEKTAAAISYIANIIRAVIINVSITELYSEIDQDTSGAAGDDSTSSVAEILVSNISVRILDPGIVPSISGSNVASTDLNIIRTIAQIERNKEFLIQEAIGYIISLYPEYNFNQETCKRDIELFIAAVNYDLLYSGNWKSAEATNYYINAANGARNALQNMFLLRDGTGLRNMTLKGLSGEFTVADTYLIKRVTAGAFASLDPGWGPDDESAWVGNKSPYIQNVTTFGTKCVGLKIDGNLHNGGNQTIVSNDFTQILSDGIGIWTVGVGKTEAVSVFSYYNYIGYFSEAGGVIRATNGNNSYGTYGCLALGSDLGETPIIGYVNNHSYEADISSVLIYNGSLLKVFFSNAGVNYSNATFTTFGSGVDGELTGDEFRDGAVFEARVVDRGDSTALGGTSYLFNTNNLQQGDDSIIRLSASDNKTVDQYQGMRLFIQSGTGTGQYGYIAAFDFTSKDVTIGNENFVPRSVTETVDSTTDYIVINSALDLVVNQKVVLSGTDFGGLTYGTTYYVKEILSLIQIVLSETEGGPAITLTDEVGEMTLHSIGWNHITSGTEIETVLDTTTVYYIEPRVEFSNPGFSSSEGTLPTASWKSITYGNDIFVSVGTDTVATSINGADWTTGTIPAGSWSSIKYGNGVFVVVAAAGTSLLRSTDGTVWQSITVPEGAYRSVVYGNSIDTWVAIAAYSDAAIVSVDNGLTWTGASLPDYAEWNSVAFGNGKFVAVSISDSTATQTAYSLDGINWSTGSFVGGCEAVAFGNGRFVVIDGTSSTSSFISLDGINWTPGKLPGSAASWKTITYGNGIFLATVTGSSIGATSTDGLIWASRSLITSSSWSAAAFGNGKFVAVSGLESPSSTARLITTGTKTLARATVTSGKLSSINIWEPGSGYDSSPIVTITDPNATAAVSIDARIGDGVIANPTITNAGQFYVSINVSVTGNGYRDQYQIGKFLVVENLQKIPSPGDNLFIGSIDDYTYRVLQAEFISGVAPNITAKLTIAKNLGIAESPDHAELLTIRQNYSQVRITGHDFLDIGLGNFVQTNYPTVLNPVGTVLAPENEFGEFGGGRIFYTSTDQDGNFRCGELFAVEQASGTVTLSADFFQLDGLEELVLGGISVGGTGTVIREFSTDQSFIADSNNIIPTQRAIKGYISARVSGGGADARTGQVISGLISVGPADITTTTRTQIDIPVPVRFTKGVDGSMLALSYFMNSMSNDAE